MERLLGVNFFRNIGKFSKIKILVLKSIQHSFYQTYTGIKISKIPDEKMMVSQKPKRMLNIGDKIYNVKFLILGNVTPRGGRGFNNSWRGIAKIVHYIIYSITT